jgi:hypothetical protein
MSLRYFDGVDRVWYDSLNLPNVAKDYVVAIQYVSWKDAKLLKMNTRCDVFNANYVLTNYDVFALTYDDLNLDTRLLVTDDLRQTLPQIWS